MKVATLFYGQPRYLNNPRPEEGYDKELFTRYAVDTYHHHWWGRDIVEYDKSTWVPSQMKPDPEAPLKIIEKFNPSTLMIERPIKFAPTPKVKQYIIDTFGEEKYNELNVSNIYSHLYSMQRVAEIAPDDYDWYAFCRTDMVIRNVPNLWTMEEKIILPNNHSNFPDTIVIFHRKFLNTWARSLYDLMDDAVVGIREPTAESFKMNTLLLHHSRDDLYPCSIYGEVVRS